MADLTNAAQEVVLTDEATGNKCNPTADGALPMAATGVTGTRIEPAHEDGNLATIATTGLARAITPIIYNVTCTNANQEYSQQLSAATKRFMIQLRTAKDLKLAFTSGDSGTLYITVPAGSQYYEDSLFMSGNKRTLYFQCATAGVVAEIVEWA